MLFLEFLIVLVVLPTALVNPSTSALVNFNFSPFLMFFILESITDVISFKNSGIFAGKENDVFVFLLVYLLLFYNTLLTIIRSNNH